MGLTAEQIKTCLDFKTFYEAELGELRPGGNGNALARCCFHDDTQPSLSINLPTGLFKCFGCGVEGDIITFYQKRHG
jgi:DNA primase